MSIVGLAHIGGTQYAAPPRPAHQPQVIADAQPPGGAAPVEGGRYVRSFPPIGADSLSAAYQTMRSFEARVAQAANDSQPTQLGNSAAALAAYAETASLASES